MKSLNLWCIHNGCFPSRVGSIKSIYGRSIPSHILLCRWALVQPKLLLSSLLFQFCQYTIYCRSCECTRNYSQKVKQLLLILYIHSIRNFSIIKIFDIWFLGTALSHLIVVDCVASTFMLMLSSFQRSYCTLSARLASMWEVSPLFRGLSVAWNHCSLSFAAQPGNMHFVLWHSQNKELSVCKTSKSGVDKRGQELKIT